MSGAGEETTKTLQGPGGAPAGPMVVVSAPPTRAAGPALVRRRTWPWLAVVLLFVLSPLVGEMLSG